MLRSLPRAVPSSSSFRTPPAIRTALRPKRSLPIFLTEARHQQTRSAADHAISNPTLASIEKRWEGMPPQEQADLWMALRDRMKGDWHDLTLQERKAGTWILAWLSKQPRCCRTFIQIVTSQYLILCPWSSPRLPLPQESTQSNNSTRIQHTGSPSVPTVPVPSPHQAKIGGYSK